MTFGERLRKARNRKKLTQEDIAKRLGIDFSTISKWENGKAEPNIETLLLLAEMCSVSVAELLDDTPATEIPPALMDAFGKASPETKERLMQYLHGDIPASQVFTEAETDFVIHLDEDEATVDDVLQQYKITIAGNEATKEELQEAIEFIKARRIIRLMKKLK